MREVRVDCDQGRRLGCASFCCRLLVQLDPGERDPGRPGAGDKHCLDKDPRSGLCVYFDEPSGRCSVWERRPRVCREYDCNSDPHLQRVLKEGFVSLTRLVLASELPPAPSVPVDDDDGE
ncbi:MAG: YkgJ family cysteine cluster protein [Myxococcales bacterium]|nr:YkgJ family cysteine cluster protein [Myxococcales bacterium]